MYRCRSSLLKMVPLYEHTVVLSTDNVDSRREQARDCDNAITSQLGHLDRPKPVITDSYDQSVFLLHFRYQRR